jgi:hypothetical protein
MEFIKKWSLFNEEINPKDIGYIESNFDDYFTISFEFEIETKDLTDIKINFDEYDDEVFDEVIKTAKSDLSIRKRSEIEIINKLSLSILDMVELGTPTLEEFNKIFDTEPDDDYRKKQITSHLKSVIMSFISIEDLYHLKKMVFEKLPNFISKWGDSLDYVGDATLDRGIEIKPKTYVKSLSSAIELLSDFWNDLSAQDYWELTNRTGLHINIGVSGEVVKWNPIKGLLLLNDFSDSNTPFVFKDMEWRMTNNFCGSMIPLINLMNDSKKLELKKLLDLGDLNKVEVLINDFLTTKVEEWGIKNLGFNISKLNQNYVEWRYVGGVVSKEVVINKLKYFSFLVYCMTNSDYKRKEYLKKLYLFIYNL